MKIKHILMAAGLVTAATFGVSQIAMAEDAEAQVEAAVDEAASAAAEVTETTLADGTKIKIQEGQISVIGEDGSETPAPDGDHELADGSIVKTVGGAIVEDAAPAAGDEEAGSEEPAAEEAAEEGEAH